MKFKGLGMQASALRVMGAAAMALLLVSCGGGQQVEPFAPTRVLAFGDENSVIEANGDKHTINFKADANTARDCHKNPIWVQTLAAAYALLFPQCTVTGAVTPSLILAEVGATSDRVKDQVDAFLARPASFGGKDLVTVLAGANDIIAQYNAIKAGTTTEAQAIAVLEQAGANLAGQVNRIGQAGGKVLISTVPDIGLTPFAVAENAAAQLTRLTFAFNTKLRINLINDGHMIGLLLGDEMTQAIAKTSGWTVDKAACLPAASVTLCDTTTLVTGAVGTAWLWADDRHMSSGGHAALGSAALSRAQGNPF